MKKICFISIISVFIFLPPVNLQGQKTGDPGDKFSLLTMPFNKRPLTLFKGQIQLNAGYNFEIRSSDFDSDGKRQSLKDFGTASVAHGYFLELKYGILDFLEISAGTNYVKSGSRQMSETIISTSPTGGTDEITLNSIDETKGFGDMLLTAAARLPFEYKMYDFMVRGGIYLPTSKHDPPEPEVERTDYTDFNSYTLNYHSVTRNGFGVPLMLISAEAKISVNKLTLAAAFRLRDPLKEGESIRWTTSLVDQNFTYSSQSYKYLLSRSISIEGGLHYQAAGWFDVSLKGTYLQTSLGWTEFWTNKYKNPEQKLFALEPGFEIQVSPLVRIRENVGLPVYGENIFAPFYIFTTFSFNLFPF